MRFGAGAGESEMNWSFLADHYPKKIARVDCSEDENMIFCAKQNLTSFPTMVRCVSSCIASQRPTHPHCWRQLLYHKGLHREYKGAEVVAQMVQVSTPQIRDLSIFSANP